jgi:hypothetical protein
MDSVSGTDRPDKHLVITASDARCGAFLVEHWLPSLECVIDRACIDIAVVDYGLTPPQRAELADRGVLLWPAVKDGHVTTVRLRDIAAFLAGHRYKQVMAVDGGDIIFQDGFAEIFLQDAGRLRAAHETNYGIEFRRFYLRGFFSPSLEPVIRSTLAGRNAVNTGVLIGPSAVLGRCLSEAFGLIVNRSAWGPDAVALNYLLYRDGFAAMAETYNCVLPTARHPFAVRQGRIVFRDGSLVKIVHNAGGASCFRVVGLFGWGAERNRVRWVRRLILRCYGNACRSGRAALAVVRRSGRHGRLRSAHSW